MAKIQVFWEIPFSHKILFLKIASLIPIVELAVHTIKFRRTVNLLKALSNKEPYSGIDELKIVGRHSNYFFLYHKQLPLLGKCLARSLSLWFLLRRKGIETDLKFGTKKDGTELLAHAWIEYKGKPLITDAESTAGYDMFSESILEKVSR